MELGRARTFSAPRTIKRPAVVFAAQPVAYHLAEAQAHPPMGALVRQCAERAVSCAKQRDGLTGNADTDGPASQRLRRVYRMPVVERSHRRALLASDKQAACL